MSPSKLVLAVSLLLVSCGQSWGPAANVVLISIDCINQRQFEEAMDGAWVPALAGLREDALVYSRAYSHAPWTTPSHMSMLTGLYPNQHGREIPWSIMLVLKAV